MPRGPVLYDIVEKLNTDDTAGPNVQNFVLGPGRRVYGNDPLWAAVVPYAIDLRRGRTIYATGIDLEEARAAPFLHLFLRAKVHQLLMVPWGYGPLHGSMENVDRIFLFSPGRCGSTLVNAILGLAGANSISEPDVYDAFRSRIFRYLLPLQPAARTAIKNATTDLAALFGESTRPLIIKLRSQICTVAREVLACGSQPPRSIFLTRQFEPWARSTAQAFGYPPGELLIRYREAVDCYRYLVRNSRCHLMRYEDLVEAPEKVCADLGDFLGFNIAADAVKLAMERDSQAGTPLDQKVLRNRSQWADVERETIALWRSSNLPRMCAELGLA